MRCRYHCDTITKRNHTILYQHSMSIFDQKVNMSWSHRVTIDERRPLVMALFGKVAGKTNFISREQTRPIWSTYKGKFRSGKFTGQKRQRRLCRRVNFSPWCTKNKNKTKGTIRSGMTARKFTKHRRLIMPLILFLGLNVLAFVDNRYSRLVFMYFLSYRALFILFNVVQSSLDWMR